MYRFVLLTFACICAAANATLVQECKNIPFPLKVVIADCDEPPCVVYKGTFAVMDVTFVGVQNNMMNITTKTTAKVFGMNLPYDLPEEVSNVCDNLLYDAMCPIDKGEDVTYRFNFYVDPVFPEITADVTVTLNDDDDNPVSCFVVSCKIRRGQTALLENTESET